MSVCIPYLLTVIIKYVQINVKNNFGYIDINELNILFYNQYDLRYAELVDTLNHILHDKLDKRVFDYLSEKSKITGSKLIKISHKEIANDLGTAREVVSRIVKKMERENILKLHHESLELL